MECMNCKGSGCMNCMPSPLARIGYDAPDLVARGEGPDTLSPEEIQAAKADIVYLEHVEDTRRGIYCCERSERLGRVYTCPDCRARLVRAFKVAHTDISTNILAKVLRDRLHYGQAYVLRK